MLLFGGFMQIGELVNILLMLNPEDRIISRSEHRGSFRDGICIRYSPRKQAYVIEGYGVDKVEVEGVPS